jgi:hypothetical protein
MISSEINAVIYLSWLRCPKNKPREISSMGYTMPIQYGATRVAIEIPFRKNSVKSTSNGFCYASGKKCSFPRIQCDLGIAEVWNGTEQNFDGTGNITTKNTVDLI